ncbi:MAG: HU family DNA-binding protein [Candidatus Kerfeldbacteria bacterium]|nr:HU family DNA-binding protein [Candidatus Kerfeldbacteria bacterium]
MNQATLIGLIAEKTNLSKKSVETMMDALLEIITDAISADQVVNLTGFGRFSSRVRSARLGVDPLHPTQKIQMPAVLVPKFKAGKALKDSLKGTK